MLSCLAFIGLGSSSVHLKPIYVALTLLDFALFLTGGIALVVPSRKTGDVVALAVCVACLIRMIVRHIILAVKFLQGEGDHLVDAGVLLIFLLIFAIVWLSRDLVRLKNPGTTAIR